LLGERDAVPEEDSTGFSQIRQNLSRPWRPIAESVTEMGTARICPNLLTRRRDTLR